MIATDKPIKQGLEEQLSLRPISAVFTGTRRTDPRGRNLPSAFQMTDPGWPSLMRVFPILDWSYADVWDFFLFTEVPYCDLYEDGYTSLGSQTDTLKNPLLLRRLPDGTACYDPAYELEDESQERLGRVEHCAIVSKLSQMHCNNL